MMDYQAEAIHLPTSRTFWNSHDAESTLDDPFEENLESVSMETCSSTFLFPSTSSTCGDESPAHAVFKSSPYQHIMIDETQLETGAESRETAHSYCTTNSTTTTTSPTTPASSVDPAMQFSWFSSAAASPAAHYHAQGTGEAHELNHQVQRNAVHGNSTLTADFFEPSPFAASNAGPSIGRHASESFHSAAAAFSKPSGAQQLMRQPSFRRPDPGLQILVTKQLNAKASWQSDNNHLQASSMSTFDQRKGHHHHKEPLGSPCSVISGFTKVLQQGADQQPVSSTDYINNLESFGHSTTPAHDHLREGPINKTSSATSQETDQLAAQSLSGSTHAGAGCSHDVRPKRKRSRAPKHGDEVESQRMTHIAVERNRRKQMNEHLAALRALMPGSYVQKGDQASIVGGAIEFVKELEHLLHCLQSQKRRRTYGELTNTVLPSRPQMPSPDQFCPMQPASFPFLNSQRPVDLQSSFLMGASTDSLGNSRQYSQSSGFYATHQQVVGVPPIPAFTAPAASSTTLLDHQGVLGMNEIVGEAKSDMASVEVKMVGSEQALVKIMTPRRSGQLLRTVVALESLALTVMHTNITTVNHTVLYSFHVQIGLHCRMNVDEIAAALHQTFSSIHSLQF